METRAVKVLRTLANPYAAQKLLAVPRATLDVIGTNRADAKLLFALAVVAVLAYTLFNTVGVLVTGTKTNGVTWGAKGLFAVVAGAFVVAGAEVAELQLVSARAGGWCGEARQVGR